MLRLPWHIAAGTVPLILVLWVRLAAAQDIPYHNYLVGDRALGLGGAFVGLADDASATFHNPAGMALLPDTSISTSFWLMAYYYREIEDAWLTNDGNSDLTNREFSSPPLVATAVAKLGRRDASGRRPHAFGFAVLKPLRKKYRYAMLAKSPSTSSLSSLDVSHSDQARWYGVSYAYDTRRRFAFGISGFLALRAINHEEIEVHGESGPTSPSRPGYANVRHSVFHASFMHVIGRVGVMWSPTPAWRFGVMLQLPTMRLSSSANNRELTFDIVDESGTSTVVQRIEHGFLTPRRPNPWEIRLGGTWFPTRRTLITTDLTIHGSAGERDDPVKLVPNAEIPRPRLLDMEAYLSPSTRAAIGGEFFPGKRVPMRGGFLVHRSGLPDLPQQSEKFSASDLNTVGASFSIGWILSGGHELSFGAAATHSWGSGSALDETTPNGARYLATPVSETTVLVFVSGGKRAFKRLAKRLVKEGGQLLRKRENGMHR
ncbi:MAG: hypothetical protein MJE77_40785 [Proteobacteria bacterium]|nr:hypothetical protein [Pseudomonadota bacterium]